LIFERLLPFALAGKDILDMSISCLYGIDMEILARGIAYR